MCTPWWTGTGSGNPMARRWRLQADVTRRAPAPAAAIQLTSAGSWRPDRLRRRPSPPACRARQGPDQPPRTRRAPASRCLTEATARQPPRVPEHLVRADQVQWLETIEDHAARGTTEPAQMLSIASARARQRTSARGERRAVRCPLASLLRRPGTVAVRAALVSSPSPLGKYLAREPRTPAS